MAQISVSHATTQSSYLQTAILTTCCYWLMARLYVAQMIVRFLLPALIQYDDPSQSSILLVQPESRGCARPSCPGGRHWHSQADIYKYIYLSKVEIDIFSDLMRRPHVQRVASSQSRLYTFQSPKSVVKPVCWCWCGSAVYGHANDAFFGVSKLGGCLRNIDVVCVCCVDGAKFTNATMCARRTLVLWRIGLWWQVSGYILCARATCNVHMYTRHARMYSSTDEERTGRRRRRASSKKGITCAAGAAVVWLPHASMRSFVRRCRCTQVEHARSRNTGVLTTQAQ